MDLQETRQRKIAQNVHNMKMFRKCAKVHTAFLRNLALIMVQLEQFQVCSYRAERLYDVSIFIVNMVYL